MTPDGHSGIAFFGKEGLSGENGSLATLDPVNPYHLSLQRPFVADHFHDFPGFQEARHGHNWEVEATALLHAPEGEAALASALDTWIRHVDYTLLNEQPALAGRNPTAETLAQWAFEFLNHRGTETLKVKVREKANYWASCRRAAD